MELSPTLILIAILKSTIQASDSAQNPNLTDFNVFENPYSAQKNSLWIWLR